MNMRGFKREYYEHKDLVDVALGTVVCIAIMVLL